MKKAVPESLLEIGGEAWHGVGTGPRSSPNPRAANHLESFDLEESSLQRHDPLAGLPSLLSLLPDWGLHGERAEDGTLLESLLDLDPILRLRALRGANSHLLREEGDPAPARSSEIYGILGPEPIRRMAEAPGSIGEHPGAIFELWLHALATAEAAQSLARLDPFDTPIDPELAYGCALVHDLSLWGTLCHSKVRGQASHLGVMDWSKAWNLPDPYQVCWLSSLCAEIQIEEYKPLSQIVIAGEGLAVLAGYGHPSRTGKLEQQDLSFLEREELEKLTHSIEEQVNKRLEKCGTSLGTLRHPPRLEEIQLAYSTWSPPRPEPLEEGIVNLLGVGEDKSLKTLLRSLVANCVRYLRCDRAFFMQWSGTGRGAMLRLKEDGTAVKVGSRKVLPSPIETALIGKIAGSCSPMVLDRHENFHHALLDHLGTDSCLIVPVAGGAMLHGFLILDQAWSLHHEELAREKARTMALVGVWGQNLTGLMLRRRDRRSQKDAFTDSLTGLLNRRAALLQLEREIARARRRDLPMSVLMLDLDRFKNWNDTYGHLTGDRILSKVGTVLNKAVRGTDIAARIGGEEFLVVQPETTPEEASLVAARIYKAIETAGRSMGIPITVSIGLTELRDDDSMDSLLARADGALYASKDQGRNRFSVDVE